MNYKETEFQDWATWLFLQDVKGLGPARIKYLHDYAGSISKIIELLKQNHFVQKWAINISSIIDKFEPERYRDIIDITYDNGAKICTLDDVIYPKNLCKSTTAPGILFYKGSLENISERSLAVVGTVSPTENGIKRADKFVRMCAENEIQIVSGLARGIDTASHKAALKHAGLTFAVVGHGIDQCYPSENKDLFEEITHNGAVISQFPTGTKPIPWMFPARNETMCTLSTGTVIIEGHDKCGSLIQAKHSFKHQRRVFILNSNLDLGQWAENLKNQGAWVVDDFNFNIVLKDMSQISGDFVGRKEMQMAFSFDKPAQKAILFDLDGVLYDSNALMQQTYEQVVSQIKGTVSDKDRKIIKDKLNNAPTYILKSLGIQNPSAKDLYNKLYLEKINAGINFFPGIENLVVTLKDMGIPIGIVTSQPFSRFKAIIKNASFQNMLDTSVTWSDIPRDQQKPHPAGILKALETLKIDPINVAYVGDDPKDIEAARRAGAKSIAALWGVEDTALLLNSRPDYVANKPADIIQIANLKMQ